MRERLDEAEDQPRQHRQRARKREVEVEAVGLAPLLGHRAEAGVLRLELGELRLDRKGKRPANAAPAETPDR